MTITSTHNATLISVFLLFGEDEIEVTPVSGLDNARQAYEAVARALKLYNMADSVRFEVEHGDDTEDTVQDIETVHTVLQHYGIENTKLTLDLSPKPWGAGYARS